MIRSLGYVTVPTPGTPVQATSNFPNEALRLAAQAIVFQALPGNAGLIYIGAKNMDKTTGANVYGIIPAPTDATNGPFPSWSASVPVVAAGLSASEFYIDAGSANDGVVISITAG